MPKYSWDIEQLTNCYNNLKTVSSKMQKANTKLTASKMKVAANWKGDAANEYLKNLQEDIHSILQAKQAIDKQLQGLKKAIDKAYQDCEDKEHKLMTTLTSKIR